MPHFYTNKPTILCPWPAPTRTPALISKVGHPRWPAATAADPEKKTTWHTTFITVRDPAALLVRSPGKPCHTAFITVAASRTLLVRPGLSPPPRRRVQPPAPTTGSLHFPPFYTTKPTSLCPGLSLGPLSPTPSSPWAQPLAPTTGFRNFLHFTPINQPFWGSRWAR